MMEKSPEAAKLEISVVIATAFRYRELENAIRSLAAQSTRPSEVIVVDGAPAPGVESLVAGVDTPFPLRYLRWNPPSAAVQRNVGAEQASGDLILFLDDDAYPEPDCLEKMVAVFVADTARSVGGVGVLIRNQPVPPPSIKAKAWLDYLAGGARSSYSGVVIGPAVNLGAQETPDGAVIDVEWLNTGCTAYRRSAFLDEKFCPAFFGYSFMEDVDLSVRVARKWKLRVHTGAFMFHDTGPSRFKAPYVRSKMSVVNRYYVMTRTLGRTSLQYRWKFFAYHAVNWLYAFAKSRSRAQAGAKLHELVGLAAGFVSILSGQVHKLPGPRGRARG